MRKIAATLVLTLSTAVVGWSQDADVPTQSSQAQEGAQMPAGMSQQMWLYLHEQKRRDDPQQAVRRKAEMRSAERQRRLASQRWFGYSKQRPVASTTPFMGTYSTFWSGNSPDPYRWVGIQANYPTIVIDR